MGDSQTGAEDEGQAPYEVRLTPAAAKEVRRLSGTAAKQVSHALDSLTSTPRPPGTKKLAGTEGLWRIRAGDYRVVYSIHERYVDEGASQPARAGRGPAARTAGGTIGAYASKFFAKRWARS